MGVHSLGHSLWTEWFLQRPRQYGRAHENALPAASLTRAQADAAAAALRPEVLLYPQSRRTSFAEFLAHRPVDSRQTHPSSCMIPDSQGAFLCKTHGRSSAASPTSFTMLTEGYSREELQPLTQYRQQHRKTEEGHLCAAAFVQNRQTYTGCTDAPTPDGDSGKPWCYLEPEIVGNPDIKPWGYCVPVIDYDAMRKQFMQEAIEAENQR
mmetsp:Transcript_126537/g.219374  ORF Transcript_126537/g.219374 Transcript_126537/m.219374 type:complete len:209 (+) Transcript_126537:19-645(+)